MKTAALALGLTGLFAAFGCGSDAEGGDLPEVDCSAQVVTFAQVDAFDKCVRCHSSKLEGSARNGAAVAVNFDSYEAAKASAEEAAHEVHEGAMPPSGSGVMLTENETQQLYRWALCGARP